MLQLDGGRVVSFSFEPIGFWFVSLFPRPWRKRVKSISPSFESKLQRTVSDLNSLNRSQQISTAQKLQNHVHTLFIPGYHIVTSSTAQGGGGSFKNRKPIGELGCCESGMAERSHWWTERCLISLTLSLSFSDYLPTYLSIFYVSIYLSIFLV